MIEVLPAGIARGIQIIGLELFKGRRVPTRALLAFKPPDQEDALQLHGVWLDAQPFGPFPRQAVRDLVFEALPELPPHPASQARLRSCPLCGQAASEKVMTLDGRPVCPAHLAEVWVQRTLESLESTRPSPCPVCDAPTPFLWNQKEGLSCTHCLVSRILDREPPSQWVLMGWKPVALDLLGDLHIFLEAWKRVSRCQRCGSVEIRLRRVLMDFPRTTSPLYPLWEIRQGDRTPEGEQRRARQLEIFTKGLMRVTLECPQCGYLEREMPGLALDPGEKPYPANDSLPIVP